MELLPRSQYTFQKIEPHQRGQFLNKHTASSSLFSDQSNQYKTPQSQIVIDRAMMELLPRSQYTFQNNPIFPFQRQLLCQSYPPPCSTIEIQWYFLIYYNQWDNHIYVHLSKASTILSLDLCPLASPNFSRSWNGNASSTHGNHPKSTSISHFSAIFKCEMKPASS